VKFWYNEALSSSFQVKNFIDQWKNVPEISRTANKKKGGNRNNAKDVEE